MVQGSLDQPPVVLQSGRKRGVFLLLVGLPFLFLGAIMLMGGSGAMASNALVFGLGLVFVVLGLATIISPAQLTIGPAGVVYKGPLKTRT